MRALEFRFAFYARDFETSVYFSFIVYDPDGIPPHIYSETGQSPD